MKICQENKNIYLNKLVMAFVFSIFIFFILFPFKMAFAYDLLYEGTTALGSKKKCGIVSEKEASDAGLKTGTQVSGSLKIEVSDSNVAGNTDKVICETQMNGVERTLDQVKTWVNDADKFLEENLNARYYKAALKYFLNTLAYDTATYLATGNEGQQPMFITKGWGEYLKDVGDNAAGAFIEEVGKTGKLGDINFGIKFNLCKPDPKVLLKINLGLNKITKPTAPTCTFSKMVSNWDAALKDKDFLSKFQDMFNPWSNDLGVALTLQTGVENEISKKVNDAAQERITNQGWLSVKDKISGNVKTPATVVKKTGEQAIDNSTASEKVYTGDYLADSIDIFINTLAGRLIEKWMKKGLVTNFATNNSSSLTDIDAENESEGVAGAESRMRSLIEPNFKVRGDYDILAELTKCPDSNKAGPTNCVMDEKFREAIEKRLTVKQAMDQGYLNANGVFGFTSDGLEPMYNEGYPYRSMLILRKFRIIPVGWEIAAQKIKDNQSEVRGTKNLSDLVNCNAPWCVGLVDPNWVLKAPQNFCKKEGAGPEILSEQVDGEGVNSWLSILRNDTYCADEQSVIKERNDGSNVYGYCTEERRIWDFNGKSCEPIDNTCQTFKLGDQTVSYLQNTLDYGVCSAANAGCKKYATTGDYNATSKIIDWNGNSDSVYLNKSAEACEAADEGCHGFIRVTPEQSETYTDIKTAGVETAYNRFSSTGLIYEKLLPDYLKSSCYSYDTNGNILDGKLLNNAPEACSDFVRECKEEEAGCELYTNVIDSSKIPAKVGPNDYCPAECSGYNTFIQKETNFDSSRDAYFIPKTGKTCSAEAVGCDQFTNLDEVAKGGEGVEYYTYLRQCLKKSDNEGSCAEFYNWEGSDESGYQLKVDSLKMDAAGGPAGESTACTKDIYNLPPSNPGYKADCRQYYNREGNDFYRLYKLTVSCSDDCHPYRKTASGDSSESLCVGGGTWNDTEKACLYMAIPGQGATCSAAQNGCREYTGNTGNDVRNIFTDDFSDGTTGTWASLNGSTISPSNESLTLGADNKGHSIKIAANAGGIAMAERQVGSAVNQGKSYVVSFLAKADKATDLDISFNDNVSANAAFGRVSLTTNWKIVQTNLGVLNHKVTSSEVLRLSPVLPASNNFYISNITLTEIVDRYYLIKNSWQTPASCDADYSGVPHELFMLGCGQYTDRADKNYYLKSFSELCSESAVGCELMIDTHNSTATTTQTFTNSGTTKIVEADSFAYVVYDKDKACNSGAKGCDLLGKSSAYDGATLYSDTYLKNNPDDYGKILCGVDAVDCQAFAYDKGEKYFKDPGDQVCEWRRAAYQGESYSWFKKKVKRCGGDGAVCLSDANCTTGMTCKLETLDKPCPTSDNKTLGLGGAGSRVSQPAGNGWAGICAAANSGCGEYIDPISKFNNNLIFNGSFINLDNNASTIDGWETGITQDVILEPNTVYRLARVDGVGSLIISNCTVADSLYEINNNNLLDGPKPSLSVSTENSKIFYYKSNQEASCKITAGNSNGVVELKPVVIDYQLAQNLDFSSCNGVVNFDKGCVLFNQRIQDGANLKKLLFDADIFNFSSPAVDSEKDSNVILKVTPDRTCDKWLAPRSYIKDEKGNNVIFDIGLCDALDENNNCSSFISSSKENQTVNNLGADKISNLSGYAKVGLNGGSLGGDYYSFGAMEQDGGVVNLANGGFEYYGSNGYPVGWIWSGQKATNKSWDANVFSVIDNPISAQIEGIGNAPEGHAFLKLGSSYDATSEDVDVIPGADYIITAYVNTKNLKSGQLKIDILTGTGVVVAPAVIQQNLGNDWQFEVGKFSSGGNSRIKIKLYSDAGGTAGSEGNFYFDDVKIRPALNSKDNWYTTQSCRLYSKTDSLSCDYYEDSGDRQKGWYGYCLEYDRAPGNPNACILWYPVDKVWGDGIEEGAGYQGKLPVYYCTKFKGGTLVESRKKVSVSGSCNCRGYGADSEYKLTVCEGSGCSSGAPHGYSIIDMGNESHCGHDCPGGGLQNSQYGLEPLSTDYITSAYGYDWYKYDGDLQKFVGSNGGNWDESTAGVKLWVPETGELLDPKIACEQIVQVVNSVGQNKAWLSRVYKGSDYNTPISKKLYNTVNNPFGSMFPPYPSNNPYEWDGIPNTEENKDKMIQPIYIKGSGANAGSPFSCEGSGCSNFGLCSNSKALCYKGLFSPPDAKYPYKDLLCDETEECLPLPNPPYNSYEIQRIFAQSYGTWNWGASSETKYFCENDNTKSCSILHNQCPGGSCNVTKQINVCSTNNVNCALSGSGQCIQAYSTEYKCGGDAKGNKCCNPSQSSQKGVTDCGGLSCAINPDGYYRCGGLDGGAVCCPNGQPCSVCQDKTIVQNTGCGDSGLECSLATVTRDYYSWGGVDDISKRCCNPNGTEGTCGPKDILVCSDNSTNRGVSCTYYRDECTNSKCISQTTLTGSIRYVAPEVSSNWGPPSTPCSYTTRPVDSSDYCAIIPVVSNVKINNSGADINLTKNGFVNLTFNSQADSNQLPLVMYAVDWGDDEKTTVTGVEMRDRPDPAPGDLNNDGNPHSLYHLYNYWDLKAKANRGIASINCSTPGECKVKPKIQVKDNWGWCSGGRSINDCGHWQPFGAWIVVKEK